ncbi:hypothetical protein B0H21DRAFT_841019 [Amylocystis lapponica]|nr:hypothetical protein B0H21DRAFT_841019 [Amylocystis lapponica]
MPESPPAYLNSALRQTKKVSQAELELPKNQRLEKVVFLPELKIFSEADAADRAKVLLLRPALTALEAVRDRKTRPQSRFQILLHIILSSRQVIPDGMVVRSGNNGSGTDVAMTIEIKAPPVFKMPKGVGKFDDLVLEYDEHPGRAMKFNWPTVAPNNDSQTRMLMQTQIVQKVVRLGTLSTSETTIFMARGEGKDRNTLFLFPLYGPTDRPLLATFCWLAMAAGILSMKDLNLPKADADWWTKDIKQPKVTGIVPQ